MDILNSHGILLKYHNYFQNIGLEDILLLIILLLSKDGFKSIKVTINTCIFIFK